MSKPQSSIHPVGIAEGLLSQKDKINIAKYTNNIFMKSSDIQYVSDEKGDRIAVIVPIEIWKELIGEDETGYLLNSETMKKRLLEAKARQTGISLEEACEKLGI